jgi:hypothetical protein
LNTIGFSLKDIIQHRFNADLTAIERTSAATAATTDRVGNTQIEAAKNRLGLEQKIIENATDIKLSNIKDNIDTCNLINGYNNDNIQNDLQSEKIIHAITS